MDDDAADLADAVIANLVISFAVAGIPRGFVVHEYVDLLLARDAADGLRIFQRDGQRLLNHYGDTVLRRDLNSRTVLGDGGVDKNSVWTRTFDHVRFGLVEQRFRQ